MFFMMAAAFLVRSENLFLMGQVKGLKEYPFLALEVNFPPGLVSVKDCLL